MGGRNFITEDQITDELLSYDSHTNISSMVTWRGTDWNDKTTYFNTQTHGIDSNTTFVYAGLHVFSDANVTTIPNTCNGTLGWLRCFDGTCYKIEHHCDGTYHCDDGADEMGCAKTADQLSSSREFALEKDVFMHLPYMYPFTDITWAWSGGYTKPTGDSYSMVKPPSQPINWVVSAISMSKDNGLGVSQFPKMVETIRDLYTSCEFPKTAKLGEQIGIQIGLTNNADYTSEVLVTLIGSKQYKFVVADAKSGETLSHFAPELKDGDIQTMVSLFPGESRYVHMPILPLRKGSTKFKISIENFRHGEICSGKIYVLMDGIPNRWPTTYFVDLVKYSQFMIPDLVIPIPERFIVLEQRNHLYIPGSNTCVVSIVGDVIGPGFYTSSRSTYPTLGIPNGHMESYFFEFTHNLWYLKYFKATDQLTNEQQTKNLDKMIYNYMQMVRHEKVRGGYSMFTREKVPSLWLTAHFFNQLKYARDSNWENQFYIPVDLMNDMATWIISNQNTSCGAFMESGPLYFRPMNPKRTTLKGVEGYWNISLTAHVVIALSGDISLTGEAANAVINSRDKASDFLAGTLADIDDPFDFAIVSWALHISNHPDAFEFFKKLKSLARADAREQWPYWASKEIPSVIVEIIDVTPFQYPQEGWDNESPAVMATSYALMCFVHNNYLDEAGKIMYWLQYRRKALGGWSNSIDTVTAMQALHNYGLTNPNRELYHMELTVTSTASPSWSETVVLDRTNFNVAQNIQIPEAWGSVKVTARGNGLALIQMESKVHVEFPEQILPPAQLPKGFDRHFDFDIALEWGGKNFSIMYLDLCTRWLRTDLGPHSQLAFIEIEIPTGYIILKEELNRQLNTYSFVKRNHFKEKLRFLIMWFEKISTEWMCARIRADRWYPSANISIQNWAIVAEYYEPEIQNKTMYSVYNLNFLHICQVCGSFQCPYCPFYNSASLLKAIPLQYCMIISISILFIINHQKWREYVDNMNT
ncbi:unnamed protein product [Owenia fusiformis]|uniref:Uncharacterized protein n=1 Tax=Owenia fusiformis TaxID=6347 RepID=A0A8S4QAQ8_OWEFU|nr:unnamed protein product [Owenia fusiformis]